MLTGKLFKTNTSLIELYTAVSRKVVGKSAWTIPEGIVSGHEFTVLQCTVAGAKEKQLY